MTNTIGDKVTEAKGKARETMGKVTGDRTQQAKGKAEQTKGKVTGAAKDLKNKVS
ncbi:MAG: CsbD family protein [Dehalococcoidia bacterium]|nr:CsbD family protein [Dehalococcoidia bacterium]